MPSEDTSRFDKSIALYDESRFEREEKERQSFIDALKKAHANGEDISKYVWPREWRLRERPAPHHAANIISLPDAIDSCGQYFYALTWTAQDWYARPLEKIDAWNQADEIVYAYGRVTNEKGADFSNKPEEEKESFSRKHTIYGKLSSWLNQGGVESFTLDHAGNKENIPNNIWLSREALDVFDSGQICEKENGQVKIWGKSNYVYINREQLEKIIKEQAIDIKPNKREELKPKGINCPEGIWSIEAIMLFSEKQRGKTGVAIKMGEVTQNFLSFLILTPNLEVFTINSFDGQKNSINRDYLKSKWATQNFLKGFIPNFDGFHVSESDGEFIFVNRNQFECVLNDLPIPDPVIKKDTQEIKKSEPVLNNAKEKSAYLNIIGALLGVILGKSSSGKPYSDFKTQQSIIDAIHGTYGEQHGLSKRNLETKFAEAKRSLNSPPEE